MDKLFYWVALGFAGVTAAIGKLFDHRLRKLEDTMDEFRVYVPENYVKRTDLKDLRDEISSALDRIYDKLDDKQDKSER